MEAFDNKLNNKDSSVSLLNLATKEGHTIRDNINGRIVIEFFSKKT